MASINPQSVTSDLTLDNSSTIAFVIELREGAVTHHSCDDADIPPRDLTGLVFEMVITPLVCGTDPAIPDVVLSVGTGNIDTTVSPGHIDVTILSSEISAWTFDKANYVIKEITSATDETIIVKGGLSVI